MSSENRPNKAGPSGRGRFCCIPGCRSSVQDNEWKSTGITVLQLPSEDPLCKEWLKVIGKFRRQGGFDSFHPKKQKVNVCEFHFKPNELYRTLLW